MIKVDHGTIITIYTFTLNPTLLKLIIYTTYHWLLLPTIKKAWAIHKLLAD